MQYKWKNSFIGAEISILGFRAVEIDESVLLEIIII